MADIFALFQQHVRVRYGCISVELTEVQCIIIHIVPIPSWHLRLFIFDILWRYTS